MNREQAKGCVGKGWASLIDEVYDNLSKTDKIWNVKEKWGGLRIDGAVSKKVWKLIEAAEDKSLEVCEFCGRPGRPRKGAWIKTLCWRCALKRKLKRMIGIYS